jgi:Tfp pilus assembly protein PilO
VPAQKELAAQRLAAERLRARTPYQPAGASGRAEELRRFYNLFPPSAELATELETLHRLARRAGLELAQGEYRLERRASGLWAYRVTLPVSGTYPQLREFIGALLKDMPIASLDALRFERKKPAETQLEAQLRVTLHVRPPGEQP